MFEVSIQAALSDEVDEAIKINEKCLPEHYEPVFWQNMQIGFPEGFLLAKVKGKICGYVACRLHDEDFINSGIKVGEITSIAVLPEYRRLGVGSKLLVAAMNAMIDAECNATVLQVREGNKSAIELYSKYGFQIMEKLLGGYADGENALRMRKILHATNPNFTFM
jgi:[ribosomal protein S18]-alanine N-acetyltransferase